MKKLLSVAFATIAASLFANQYETTGAAVSTDGDDEIYMWTETNTVGTIVVPEGGALFDILLVGGGGAGGWCRGGGGGGGGVVYQTGVFFEAGTYSIAVCAMTRLVGELEPAGDLSSDPAKYHVMRFRGKGGHDVFAAWSVEGEAKVPRPAEIPPTALLHDLLGARLGASVPEALTLTEDPVYFVRQ